MTKRVLLVLLIVAACVGTTFASGSSESTSSASSTQPQVITIWGWDNSDLSKATYAAFSQSYPQYTIATTVVQRQDMEQKLQTALASGADVPDVAWVEATYRGSLLALDIWTDISKAPYNYDKNNVLPYLLPLETTAKGVYVGPEVPSVGGMAYKRPLAKQYLGTDDPAELQKMFPTWQAFIDKGKQVLQASGGKVYMLSSPWDALIFAEQQTNTPFVVDGTHLNLEKAAAPILKELIDMKQAGIVDTFGPNSPSENASYADSTHIFYPCANWSVTFTIKRNDPNGSGRWGFMIPPGGPFPMGGTVQGVPLAAKHKMAAVTFLKWRYQSVPGAQWLWDKQGYFSPLKSLYDNGAKFYDKVDPFFGGQNLGQIFALDVLAKIKNPRVPSKYDQQINDAFNVAVQTLNTGAAVTVQGLIKAMEDDLIQQHPELQRG
ncbi:MAG TPA: ABC transporter substrate-binding protein [Spirochaetia bacterium]|nr:ABC transporter substrate-binding protein [Spirochaetia bacterium]